MFGLLDRQLLYAGFTTGRPAYLPSTDRVRIDSTAEANLVSSLIVDSDRHAPSLDVDHPLLHQPGSRPGTSTVWVRGLDTDQWLTSWEALDRAGLAAPCPAQEDDRLLERIQTCWRDATELVDLSEALDFVRSAGPEFPGTFDLLMVLALHDTPTSRASGLPVTDRPAAQASEDGWLPLPLIEPALVLPSTHNHHLYIERLLDHGTYFQLMADLVGSGLVEPGYYGASMEREATHLRLPWIRKEAA